jgi:DNA-binding transcriptional regulator GbsR (MarR family)
MHGIKLIEDDRLLVCQPTIASSFGHGAAVLFSQIHYWIQNNKVGIEHKGNKWFYSTIKELAKQVKMSPRNVSRHIKNFIDHGLLKVEKLSKHKSNRTNYYSIPYNNLENIIQNIQEIKKKHTKTKCFSNTCGKKTVDIITKSSPTNQNTKLSLQENIAFNQNQKHQLSDQTKSNSNITDDGAITFVQKHKIVENQAIEGMVYSQTIGKPHCDNLSSSLGQIVTMVIHKLPTKKEDISEEIFSMSSSVGQILTQNQNHLFDTNKNSQQVLLQVNKISNKNLENKNQFIKNNIAIEMLEIWNNNFTNNEAKLNLNLARFLVACFKNKFDSQIKSWEEYCKNIKTSKYLTGENFVLSLDWAIKYNTIDKIKNGYYGIKKMEDENHTICEEVLLQKALEHIENVDEPEICKKLRKDFLKIVGAAYYISWFTQVDFLIRNNQVQFKAQNKFVEDTIMEKWGSLFKLEK